MTTETQAPEGVQARRPLEPTPEMVAAARAVFGANVEDTDEDYTRIIRAALAAPAPQAAPVALTERLRRFLDAAAGDGFELDGVDAGELYLELFPGAFAAPQTKEPTNDR